VAIKDDSPKCAFDITLGKFLGFVVRHRGIEIDQDVPPPKNFKEVEVCKDMWHMSEDSYQILPIVATLLATS